MKSKTSLPTRTPAQKPLSPFANPLHHGIHPVDPEIAQRMKALAAQYANPPVEPLPAGLNPNPVWTLADVLGDGASGLISQGGQTVFHAVGDTGIDSYPIRQDATVQFGLVNGQFQKAETTVVEALAADCDPNDIQRGPAFLFHLGDVIYFDNTQAGYAQQFYEAFSTYPRKIIAIPGNHDCEVLLGHQAHALDAFVENFCQKQTGVPPAGRYIAPPREMLAQPNVYWRLDAPFVQIIALCSNVGETQGTLEDANNGTAQIDWLGATLAEVLEEQRTLKNGRRALIVALHHPPYTQGNHVPSVAMNQSLDRAFTEAGVWPDAVLAAHDHMYERYTRRLSVPGFGPAEIPYLVVGGGSRFTMQSNKGGSSIPAPIPGVEHVVTGSATGMPPSQRPGDG